MIRYNYKKLSNLIVELQKSGKLNQQDIAKKIGVHFNALQKHNAGTVMPSLKALCKYAIFFEKDLNHFFDIDDTHLNVLTEQKKSSKYENNNCETIIELLKSQIDLLSKQLEKKDNVIDGLLNHLNNIDKGKLIS